MIVWTLTEPQYWRPYPWSSTKVRLTNDARNCVVFLGECLVEGDDSSFKPVATGFLVTFWEKRFFTYLVTNKHVAMKWEDEVSIRMNLRRDGAVVDTITPDWTFHEDDTVDLAVMPYIPSEAAAYAAWGDTGIKDPITYTHYGAGDLTYMVGLFRAHGGRSKNVALVHTGNIAAYSPDDRVEVDDWDDPDPASTSTKLIDAYIVQCHCLEGSSGSPVFVRARCDAPSYQHKHSDRGGAVIRGGYPNADVPVKAYGEVFLLGVWRGSWEITRKDKRGVMRDARYPAGYGTAVPSFKLYEVLDMPKLKSQREAERKAIEEYERERKERPVADSLPREKAKIAFDKTLKKMLDTPPDPRVKSK